MEDNGVVFGSKESSKPLVIGIDTVWEHTNITPYATTEYNFTYNGYKYHEVQYHIDEYLRLRVSKEQEAYKKGVNNA